VNNPSELWKTFKSVERKEAGGNSEVKELIADFENIVKHVAAQLIKEIPL
jgi:hypothetical protein